jgi:hypothetical protein
MPRYGRDDSEWDLLVHAGLTFLVDRARLGRVTSYTELNTTLSNRTHARTFDFERADERAAMGELLGLIVERNRPETGLMISALVHYLGENDAGPGFYVFAQDLGLLAKNASQDDKLTFWVEQVSALHRYYARP